MNAAKALFLIILSVVNWFPASVWDAHHHHQAPVCLVAEHHHSDIEQGCNLRIRFGHAPIGGCTHQAHISHYKNACDVCSQHWLIAFFEQTHVTKSNFPFAFPWIQTQDEQPVAQHLIFYSLRGPPSLI